MVLRPQQLEAHRLGRREEGAGAGGAVQPARALERRAGRDGVDAEVHGTIAALELVRVRGELRMRR